MPQALEESGALPKEIQKQKPPKEETPEKAPDFSIKSILI
jgi:hypothetical protein